MILDIHTHNSKFQTESVVSLAYNELDIIPNRLYSIGIHPWNTVNDDCNLMFDKVCNTAANPQIVAIGECGIDLLRGAELYKQIQIFSKHIELSEELNLPLIIHNVKAHEIILGLYSDYRPKQKWAIHGFRNKPAVAKMFIQKGIYLSMGEYFNTETLHTVPHELLLAETDESELEIREIINRLSVAAKTDLLPTIAKNTAFFLKF